MFAFHLVIVYMDHERIHCCQQDTVSRSVVVFHVYQYADVGRVQTELVRPSVNGTVGGKAFGGFTYEKLRVAAVARCAEADLTNLLRTRSTC